MINIERLVTAPEGLSKNSMIGVKEALIEMHNHKCYLCEQLKPLTTHIEHFESKNHNPDLEFVWSNLFLACDHCNSIKNYVSDSKVIPLSLLKPDDFSIIISDTIKVKCGPNPKEKIEFFSLPQFENNIKVTNTVSLLNNIFNYSTESLSFDSKALTDNVIRELKKLLDLLHVLEFDSHTDEIRQRSRDDIKHLLSKKSPFTAFKIWYLRHHFQEVEIVDYLPEFKSE